MDRLLQLYRARDGGLDGLETELRARRTETPGDRGASIVLARIAREHADREALVEVASGRRWTYAELDRDVDRVARGLIAAGIAKGDRVGIWSPNCAEWTLVQYATAKIGAVLVNVNPAYRTHELAFVLNQSGLRLLVSATDFKTSDYRAMVAEVAETATSAGVSTLERVVFLGTDDWDELLAGGEELPADVVPERMATLSNNDPPSHAYKSSVAQITNIDRSQCFEPVQLASMVSNRMFPDRQAGPTKISIHALG